MINLFLNFRIHSLAPLALILVGCVYPGNEEPEPREGDSAGECSDDADNDADGAFDCDDTDCAGSSSCESGDTETDDDGDGYGIADGDCDDTDPATYPGASEYCNSIDDNCDGVIDEDSAVGATTWHSDDDDDSYGDAASPTSACTQPAGYVADNTDCDDTDPATYPGASEYCNSIDDNCDGEVDEDSAVDATTWYSDADSDSFGDAASPTSACTQPAGYVADNTDCDDTRAETNPGASEYCNSIDDDCNGAFDDDYAADAVIWYSDADSDSFGDAVSPTSACTQPAGHVADNTDCDDTDSTTFPGADETCDGADDNCDGEVDEDSAVDAVTFFADSDSDTYGNPSVTWAACAAPAGYVAYSSDCDDSDSDSNPGADETCDGADNNCDGEVDDDTAVDATTWYSDNDSDSYGDLSITIVACNQPADYVADATDCDDGDADSHPGADEYCDGTDSDCDAVVDNDALDATTFFADSDSDSYGNASDTTAACSVPSGYVTDSSDCDDTDPALSPGNADTWYDGFDSDCAGNDDFDQDGDGQQSVDYGGDDCADTNPLQYTIDGYCPTDWTQVYAIVGSGTSMTEASRMISDCEGRWSVSVGAYWRGITGFFSAAGIVPADLPALVYENISPYWVCEVVLIYEGVDSDGEVLWSYERSCSVANDVDYTWETNCDAP